MQIPLPPLPEQQRIVAEVERLNGLVDVIEQNQGELNATIAKAKAKILDLAIHGKLVPQNPSDEPASALLTRINPNWQPSSTNPFPIPTSWQWVTCQDVFRPMSSKLPEGVTFKYIDIDAIDNKVNTCSPKTISSNNAPSRASRHTNKGDVVFSMVRPYLKNIAVVEEDGCIASTGFYVFKPTSLITTKYTFYLLQSNYVVDGLNQFMKGDNSPSISKSNIDKWQVPLPPLAEQQRIVAEVERLNGLVDVIEQNQGELNATIAKAKAKILDLAIHGKLVPQNPSDEPASDLLTRINPNWHPSSTNPFPIPPSWQWTTLGELGKWQAGGTPSRSNKSYFNGNIPWLKTGDLNDGYITNIPECITQEAIDNSSAKLNPTGSVLIAMYGATIGKVGILTFPATTNQACCACVNYQGKIEQKYLFYFLIHSKQDFIMKAGGGAQPNISKDIIVQTQIPLPPLAEQQRIVEAIEAAFAALDAIQSQIKA